MTKKKAKKNNTGKKAAKKKSAKSEKEMNPVEVRKEILKMIGKEATEMVSAVIGEGKKGQLAPVKYFFEVAKILPEPTNGTQATEEDDSLAKILLARFTAPPAPLKEEKESDEEENASLESVVELAAGNAAENQASEAKTLGDPVPAEAVLDVP